MTCSCETKRHRPAAQQCSVKVNFPGGSDNGFMRDKQFDLGGNLFFFVYKIGINGKFIFSAITKVKLFLE